MLEQIYCDYHLFKYSARIKLTDLLIYLIKKLNPYKDPSLSRKLHDVADEYDKNPTGEWKID